MRLSSQSWRDRGTKGVPHGGGNDAQIWPHGADFSWPHAATLGERGRGTADDPNAESERPREAGECPGALHQRVRLWVLLRRSSNS